MRRVIEVLACSIIETGADAVVNASNPDAVLRGPSVMRWWVTASWPVFGQLQAGLLQIH